MNRHTAQYILTPKGERLAVLDAAEFDAMIDELDDLRETGEIKHTLAAIRVGEIEMIPAEIVNRIVFDGENPIRVYRDWRGMTTKQLGEAVGISHAYISQIETGKRQGTVDVMQKIARALRVNLDDLVMEQ